MTYRGQWIICRNCLFPIRLPMLLEAAVRLGETGSIPILLACPVCAYVEPYSGTELKATAFRIPDPFRQKKAALYVVNIPCRVPHCKRTARIHAVAATTLSVTSLLELWQHWVIHDPCSNHAFKARQFWTWGVYGVPRVHERTF